MDVRERYALAKALADTPGKASATQLIAMLDDDGSYLLDDGCSLFDRDPTEVFVWQAALALDLCTRRFFVDAMDGTEFGRQHRTPLDHVPAVYGDVRAVRA